MNTLDLCRRLRILTEPTVMGLGFDLVAIEWLTDIRGAILRLSIDSPNGIAAKDCAYVSSHISQLLDEHDPVEGSYRLEVSSPGIERPLQRLKDFARFKGLKARVRLVEGNPRRRMSGVIEGVEGTTVITRIDGQELRFDVDAVEKAHLILDLDEFQRLADGEFPELPANDQIMSEESHDHE